MLRAPRLVVFCASAFILTAAHAQQSSPLDREIDPALAKVLASTAAFDNHAHPVLPPPNDETDRDFDALPVDNMAPQTDPVFWRPDYPQLHDAWQALYGVNITPPLTSATREQLKVARAAVKKREGIHYDEWLLEKAGIGTQVANRVAPGPGVAPPRFLWVPYDDALLFPLDNSGMATTPDRAAFYPLEDKVRARYLGELGVKSLPPTLDEYIQKILLPTVRRQHEAGAIAVKFELAYLRALDIGDPAHDEVAAVYAKFARGGAPAPEVYKPLQDFLFRAVASEAGRLGMAVHIHCMAGTGSYFSHAGVNPANLEPIFNDPRMRHTNFVLLHGGHPYVHEVGAMLMKPNVYLDISQQAITIPARTLSTWVREWLELYPEKVLFATDGYPYSLSLGWEESTWLGARNARRTLGLALTGMMRDGDVSPARAAELARMVLRNNAEALYKATPSSPR